VTSQEKQLRDAEAHAQHAQRMLNLLGGDSGELPPEPDDPAETYLDVHFEAQTHLAALEKIIDKLNRPGPGLETGLNMLLDIKRRLLELMVRMAR
jgi:hypothetical protein